MNINNNTGCHVSTLLLEFQFYKSRKKKPLRFTNYTNDCDYVMVNRLIFKINNFISKIYSIQFLENITHKQEQI